MKDFARPASSAQAAKIESSSKYYLSGLDVLKRSVKQRGVTSKDTEVSRWGSFIPLKLDRDELSSTPSSVPLLWQSFCLDGLFYVLF